MPWQNIKAKNLILNIIKSINYVVHSLIIVLQKILVMYNSTSASSPQTSSALILSCLGYGDVLGIQDDRKVARS